MLEEQLGPNLNSIANVSEISARNGTNDVTIICERQDCGNYTSIENETDWMTNASDSFIRIDDLNEKECIMETFETETTIDTTAIASDALSNANAYQVDSLVTQNTNDRFFGPVPNDEMYGTNNDHESNTNEDKMEPEAHSDYNFFIQTNESSDLTDMFGIGNDSTADDGEPIPVNGVSTRLNETALTEWTKAKSKTKLLNRINRHEKRMMKTEKNK